VPVDFLDDALDPHGLAVEVHFLAVLCLSLASDQPN
jgi:hypothetical protein